MTDHAPLDFSTVVRPDVSGDTPPPDPDITSSDPTCEECGAAIPWSGRGRRPKRCDEHKRGGTSSARRTPRANDVERACESLNGVYTGLLFPLTALSPNAGAVWEQQIDGLNARNRTLLANNKPLVDRINKGAEKGGTVAFILSHVIAVAPVMLAVRMDMASREPVMEPPTGDNVHRMGPVTDPTDPDFVFKG